MSEEEETSAWAIRRARANVQDAWEHFAVTAGEEVADAWQEELEEAASTLSRLPFRCPIAPEANLFGPPEVRRLLYRRTRNGPAYHVLFRIFDVADAPLDARFVRIIAIRHAAQAPLTEDEAELIEGSEP